MRVAKISEIITWMMDILDVLVKKVKTGMLQDNFIHFYVFVSKFLQAYTV